MGQNELLYRPPPLHLPSRRLFFMPVNPGGPDIFSGYRARSRFLGTEIYHFPDKTILCGFIGYPQLNLLLSAIRDLEKRIISFLGIAGEIGRWNGAPGFFQVSEIMPSGAFCSWPESKPIALPVTPPSSRSAVPPAIPAVSVDCIRRETGGWLQDQLDRGSKCVEMELYPLCYQLKSPPRAILVTSDAVTPRGIRSYRSDDIKKSFREAYRWITGPSNSG